MKDVIARLEAAAEGSRELDIAISAATCRRYAHVIRNGGPIPYTTSIDAALTLVPAGWYLFELRHLGPERWYTAFCRERDDVNPPTEGEGKTGPLALCIAALRARLATEGGAPEPVRGESAEDGKSVMAENRKDS